MAKNSLNVNKLISQGKSLEKRGEIGEAKLCFEKVLKKFPNNSRARSALSALVSSQNLDEFKDGPELAIERLIATRLSGQLEQAKTTAIRLASVFPKNAFIQNFLGSLYFDEENYAKAVNYCLSAVDLESENFDANYNLGSAFVALHQFDEALPFTLKALSIKPDFVNAIFNHGVILQNQDRFEDAIAQYKDAVRLQPDFFPAHNNLGVSYSFLNDKKNAELFFAKALTLDPTSADCHNSLSQLKTYKADDPQISQISLLLVRSDLPEKDECQLNFAMAYIRKSLNDTEKYLKHLKKGNDIRTTALPFDLVKEARGLDKIKMMLEENLSVSQNGNLSSRNPPIFIVGMPRSGTTLTEQILSSHSEIYGVGELTSINEYMNPILKSVLSSADRSKNSTQNIDSKNVLQGLQKHYFERLGKMGFAKKRVADKMPGNFKWVGHICSAFPDAKIVCLERDPRAVGWSIYQRLFTTPGLGYAYNMENLAGFYNLFSKDMEYWNDKFPDRIFKLDYEELVRNQEPTTRKLLKFCELDWQERCLNFHENTSVVRTASSSQVRRKLYKGSSDVWRKYENFLETYLVALEKYDMLPSD